MGFLFRDQIRIFEGDFTSISGYEMKRWRIQVKVETPILTMPISACIIWAISSFCINLRDDFYKKIRKKNVNEC
jgi:hypothetical protein